MKAYRKEPDFKPVVIEIESEDELLYLFHCLAVHKADVRKLSEAGVRFPCDVDDDAMFKQFDKIVHSV